MSSKNFQGSNTLSDDDFIDNVPKNPRSVPSQLYASTISAMVTRSQSHNAEMVEDMENRKGKGVVADGSPSRIKRKRGNGKRPQQQFDVDSDDDPTIKTKKVLRMKAKSVKTEYVVDSTRAPPCWKTWDFYTPREHHASRPLSTHTNTKIVSDLEETLTDRVLERFKASCFGHFLNMPDFSVQNQLLVALLFREVVRPSHDALWFIINGKKLKFGLKEFAMVTGLKCEGDFLKNYSTKVPNRLVQTYFNSEERVSKTALCECFKLKMWQNEDDALKIAVLYFINTFLYSTKNSINTPHLIDSDHFELVESGEWETFPWGTKVFLATIESMHDKVRLWKSSRRFAGLPYALLVWFYECCPTVHLQLATRVAHRIPRILNWEVTKSFTFHDLQTGFFALTGRKMIIDNITPSELEKTTLHLPPDEEPEVDKDIPVEQQQDLPDIDETVQPCVDNAEFVRREYLKKELEVIIQNQLDLKKEIQAVTQRVVALNDFMIATADRIFVELDEISKKAAALFDPNVGSMEANISFGGFGSDHEVYGDDVPNNNKVPGKANTALDDGAQGDASNFTPLSAQDIEIIDELERNAVKASAERKSASNRAAHVKMVLEDGDHSGMPNFKLFDSQDFGEVFGNHGLHSAEGKHPDSVDGMQYEPAYDKTPFNDSNEKDKDGVGLVEGIEMVRVVEQQASAIYDKTPLVGSNVKDGEDMGFNFKLFSTQDFEEIFEEQVKEQSEGLAKQQNEEARGNVTETVENSLTQVAASPNNVTPPNHSDTTLNYQSVRTIMPAKFNRSPPFTNSYGDSGNSPIAKKMFYSVKHPFTSNNLKRVNSTLAVRFSQWIKNGLRKTREEPYHKNANILKPKFDFGVCLVGTKDWFHTLYSAENPFEDTHLDVILYYLRKKAKYDHRVSARVTTTDCLFDSILRDVYNNYLEKNKSLSVVADNHILSDYMKGMSIRCNVPWRLVDDVLFPIKVVDDWHWVLGRLSFRDRVFYVYDQKLDNFKYDNELIEALEPYSILIPLFLSAISFYDSRNDLNIKMYKFGETSITDPFILLHCYDMTRVRKSDYGVFAAAFAEHFIHGHGMPERNCKITHYRKRYGALLWDYGLTKQFQNAISDPEE